MALSSEPNETPTQVTAAIPSTARKRHSLSRREARRRRENVQQNASAAAQPEISKYYPDKPPDRGTPIRVSHDELFKIACNYEEYSCPNLVPNVTIREGLQNMDDVTRYGVTEEQQKELWNEEISRLSSAVTDLKTPISFNGTEELSHETKDAYEILADLADQMWIALNIILHDTESIHETHFPELVDKQQQDQSRRVLQRLTGDDDEEEDSQETPLAKEGLKSTREDYFGLVNYVTATLARMFCKAAYGKTWHENILVCLVKLSTKMKVLSTQREEFASISLSMAPSRKKLKPAATNYNYARKSGHLGMNREGHLESLDEKLQSLIHSQSTEETYSSPETERKLIKRHYLLETTKYRLNVNAILRRLVVNLRGHNQLTTTSNTSYEVCAMLYDTGFEDFPNLVFQDRNGEYLGSSRQENVNVSQAVFDVLDLTLKELEAIQQKKLSSGDQHKSNIPQSTSRLLAQNELIPAMEAPTAEYSVGDSEQSSAKRSGERLSSDIRSTLRPQEDGSSGAKVPVLVGTTISWNYMFGDSSSQSLPETPGTPNEYACSGPEPKRLSLESMSEVIMAMVPLLLANPKTIDMATDFIGLCVHTAYPASNSETTETQVLLYQHTKFKAFFCLTTDEYRNLWKIRPHRPVSQLSKALMARDNLLSRKTAEAILVHSQTLPLTISSEEESERRRKEDKERIERGQKELDEARKKMSGWVFEEKGVRVKCGWYVWTVLTIANTLALGGIAIGVSVNNRLRGVDPFGITTFCWVLAAFVILMAKSIRVENWPWRDFLHQQVLCRTVSELHSVTGINEQLILAKLLHDEPKTILQTRGPYNCVFTRRAENGDGFSIDRPLSIRTMLLSGLIMIQVQAAYSGEFLVCLDVRRGGDYKVVLQSNDPTENREYIVSDRFSVQDTQAKFQQRIPLKRAKNARWNRIIGVYGQRDALFV